jgi:hypothetical protein
VRAWAKAEDEVPRVKGHLAKYYEKMGDEPPWGR